MANKQQLTQYETETIIALNQHGKIGILKLSKLFRRSSKTIQHILGNSVLTLDKNEVKNMVYNADIEDSEIDYFIDSTILKLKPLWKHDYQSLKTYPKPYLLVDKRGNFIDYLLSDIDKSCDRVNEYAFYYLQLIIKANLPKNSKIHVDIYSTWLFREIENRGYIPIHKNKRCRDFPFYTVIERQFANIQKHIRRLAVAYPIKTYSDADKVLLTTSLIHLWCKNDITPFLRVLQILTNKQQIINTKQIVKSKTIMEVI